MVIRGGENVYPREVEEFLYTHPAVPTSQVIGVPDDRYGEELMAWIRRPRRRDAHRGRGPRVLPGPHRALQGARATCKFVDEFPMTVTGKVQKFKMRETAVTDLGLRESVTA